MLQDLHVIKVFAEDGGQPSRQAEIQLEIRVLDVNDVAPKFEKEAYEFTVSENSSPGTVVGALRAFDADLPPFNATSFYIVDGNPDGLLFYFYFFVVFLYGSLFLQDCLAFIRTVRFTLRIRWITKILDYIDWLYSFTMENLAIQLWYW